MKRFKKVFILLGIVAVVCIATLIVTNIEERKENIQNTGEIILSVDPSSVTSLAWEYNDTSLSFSKNTVWQWDEDTAFPVNEDKIYALLETFEEFGAAFIIEDVEDTSQYGLDKPICTIRFSTDQEDYQVVLGAYSTMDSQRYVSIGDGNVYLVKNDPFETYEIELSDTILHDETPSFDKLTGIVFEGMENYSVSYEENSNYTYCPSDLYFTQKDGKTVPLDTDRVEDYCAGISSLNLRDYVSYNVTEEELAAWGLDDPALTVTVNYTVTEKDSDEIETETPETFVLHIGQNQEELAAKEEAEAAAQAAEEAGEDPETDPDTLTVTSYIRVGDSPIVYEISSSDYQALTSAAYNDFRHKEVLTADFADITQIDITLESKDYSITSEIPEDGDEDDADRVYVYDGEELDITDLKSKMSALTVSSFIEDEPEDREEICLVFYLDNELYPQVNVTLYRYDGTFCLVAVDGEILGLVSRSSVVDLIEAVNGIVLG